MKFSVLIPNLGFNQNTKKCLISINNLQKLDDFDTEIIICDQSSAEEKNKLYNFVKNWPQFKIISIKERNVLVARKTLLNCATGDYIFFADSDDYVDKNHLVKVYKSLKREKFPDLLITSYTEEYEQKSVINNDLNGVNKTNISKYFYNSDLFNTLWRKIFKRKIYNKLDIENLNSINGDDWIISYSLFKNAKTISFDENCYGYHYCPNKNSLTRTMTFERFKTSFVLKDPFILNQSLDINLLFNNKIKKFNGYCFFSFYLTKNWHGFEKAFLFVHDNLFNYYSLKFKNINGFKNKICYLLLKWKAKNLYQVVLKLYLKNK